MIRALVLSSFLVLGVLFSTVSFASLLRSFSWLFDVLTHFTLYYTLGLAACLLGSLLLRAHAIFPSVFALALLVNAVILLPFFTPRSPHSLTNEALRVMSLNVLTDNQDYARIANYLREANADVVLLSEIEPALMATLKETLADVYPHTFDESMDGTHGLAFISKQPFTVTDTVLLDERHNRFLVAELLWQGRPVNLYGAHPHPPFSPFWTKSRDEELRVIQDYLARESKPHIFLGDFNAAPWSKPLQQLVQTTKLRHAALGFGMYPTWRYKTMLAAAPLDHIYVSAEWQVDSYKLGPDVGSDHFPVIAEVQMR